MQGTGSKGLCCTLAQAKQRAQPQQWPKESSRTLLPAAAGTRQIIFHSQKEKNK